MNKNDEVCSYSLQLSPIGLVRSCFPDKFGVPRQPGLVPEAEAVIELLPPWNTAEAVRGLEQVSHLWVIFAFHLTGPRAKATVRPPRLGGNKRLGVFATRSNFRPNPLGLSLVAIEKIVVNDGVKIYISGVDIINDTPVLDIKPYLPFVESVPNAVNYIAENPPSFFEVSFSETAVKELEHWEKLHPRFTELLRKTLAMDPRPAYMAESSDCKRRTFASRLFEADIVWKIADGHIWVEKISKFSGE